VVDHPLERGELGGPFGALRVGMHRHGGQRDGAQLDLASLVDPAERALLRVELGDVVIDVFLDQIHGRRIAAVSRPLNERVRRHPLADLVVAV